MLHQLALACVLTGFICHAVLADTTAQEQAELTETLEYATRVRDSTPITADQILAYFPMDDAESGVASCLLGGGKKVFLTRKFGLQGKCNRLDDEAQLCAYRDYRKLDLDSVAGFDQRGVYSYQVTFPGTEHLYAALSLNNDPDSLFCWVGGALVGQNPLAMTWSSDTGTKRRKNNFILNESGTVQVEGARLHNLHDAFMASGPNAGFHVQGSWISWNRDDLFEGYLHDLQIDDTLVDGTYTFISDPDGECDTDKKVSGGEIVIQNSMIRLQRQPGPFARHTAKWHWAVEGGHNTLWKLDSCGWKQWPRFILRNNVFLIEGPRTTFSELNHVDCRLALPGSCSDPLLSNLKECRNNLFLYTQYYHWRNAGAEPGPVPQREGRFYNANNPKYLPNGVDCYQRLTDDTPAIGSANVDAIWRALRQQWIERHTKTTGKHTALMTIPGVDFPVFGNGSKVIIANRKSGECLDSGIDRVVRLAKCDESERQVFSVERMDGGKLTAAVRLRSASGRYLTSNADGLLEAVKSPERLDRDDFVTDLKEGVIDRESNISVGWYVMPITNMNGVDDLFYIESDALQRSFLRQENKGARVQAVFEEGTRTSLPQDRFVGGNDENLQWELHETR